MLTRYSVSGFPLRSNPETQVSGCFGKRVSRNNGWLIAGILLLTSGVSNAGTVADVMVRPEVEVSQSNIDLGGIASIKADKALTAKLESISICAAPLPGRSITIRREQIVAALRRKGLEASTNLLSPAQIAVTRAAMTVTGQTMFETARKFVLESETFRGATVEVEAIRLPSDLTVPSGKIELRVGDGGQRVRRGRNSLPVQVLVDGKPFRTVYVSVLARVFGRVVVAAQPIAKNEFLTAVNTKLLDCETTYVTDEILTALPDADTVAAVPIAEGAQLRRNWISTPPVIKSGDTVVVSAVGNFVRVSDKGAALADGRIGDRIKVRLGDSREIRGTVAGPGLVEIYIGTRS